MKLKNQVFSNYENVRKADIKEIWEVVILGTKGGTTRVGYTLTEDLQVARKIAENYKDNLNNCQEVIIAKLKLIDNEYQEIFGRIVFSKRDNKVKASQHYHELIN